MKQYWDRLLRAARRTAASVLEWARSRLSWPDPDTNSRRVNMILGALAAGNFLVFLILTDPMYQIREVRVAEWEALTSRIEQRERSVDRMERQRSRLQRQRDNLVRFHDDILSDKVSKLTTIQREIRSLATQFHVNPETVSYAPEYLKDQDLVSFEISFPLRGSYENLRQFIQSVESSRNFLIINDISLADSREGGVLLSVSIRLRTFFQDSELAAGRGSRS